MSRKDVNLVIRAKDEATRAVDSITAAFASLVGSTEQIQKTGKGANSALGKLGAALESLDRSFRGMSGATKLAQELDKAKEAVSRLETEATEARASLEGLGTAQTDAAKASEKFAAKTKGAAAALEKQEAAVQKAKGVAAEYQASVSQTEKELSKLETRQRNLPAAIERTTTSLDKATARYENLSRQVEKAEKPSATLIKRQEEASAAVVKQTEKLTKLTTEQSSLAAAIEKTVATVASQKTAFEGANAAVAKQATVYGQIKANAAGLAVELRAAEVAENTVNRAVDQTTASLERNVGALNKAQVEYGELAAASAKATGALQQFVGAGRGSLEQALRAQGSAIATAKGELVAQERAVRDYAAALSATNAPTARMVADLANARAASRQMRAEIATQEAAFKQMSSALKATSNDYDSIIAAQKRFTEVKASAGASLAGIRGSNDIAKSLEQARQSAALAAADLNKAKAAAADLGNVFARIGPPTLAEAEAMDKARAAVRLHRQELAEFGTAAGQLTAVYDRMRAGTLSFEGAQRQAAQVNTNLAASLARVRAEAAQVASTTQRAVSGLRQTGSAAQDAAGKTNTLSEAFRKLFGEQRQSLSIMGRIRAQLVALTSAYVGLYGAIGGVSKTIDAFQTLEAAQSRLNVVFNGDQGKVGEELDFLRRTSDRLKVSFGTLADEYTKFAVATKNTPLEGADTRKIFTSVTEAARVYKLDEEQVKGVFKALTDVASKGTIQMEELRQQLGDRLPGAMQILADGMGITVEELSKLTAAGAVSSTKLVNFADELSRRVGPQLSKALESTTAEFGAFSNNVFQAFLRLGQGGFIDAITDLIKELNKQLTSPEFDSFVDRVSAGLSALTSIITGVVSNFRLVITVIGALIGLKLGAWAVAAYGAFNELKKRTLEFATSAKTARAEQVAMTASTSGFSGAITRAAGAVRVLGLSIKALGAATLVGAAFTVISTALSYLLTSATDANTALDESTAVLDRVKNALDSSEGSIDKFREALKGLTVTQLEETIRKAEAALKDLRAENDSYIASASKAAARRAAGKGFANFGIEQIPGAEKAFDQLEALEEKFKSGALKAEEFKKAVEAVASSSDSTAVKSYAAELENTADKALAAEKTVTDLKDAKTALTGETNAATDALDRLGGGLETAESKLADATAATNRTQEALRKLREEIPGIAEEMKRLADLKGISEIVGNLGFNEITPEVVSSARAAVYAKNQEGYEKQFRARKDTPEGAKDRELVTAVNDLAKQMGLTSKDLIKVMSYETGGKLDPAVRGGKDNKYVGLIQSSPDVQRKYGVNQQSSITEQVKAAGKYLADAGVKAGDGINEIYTAIQTGSANLKGLGKTDGQFGTVRDKIASMEEGHGARAAALLDVYDSEIKSADSEREQAEKRAATAKEKADTYRRERDEDVADRQDKEAGGGTNTRDYAVEKAAREEIEKAQKAGVTLTAQEIAQTRELAGLEYDRSNAKKEGKADTQEANQALATANALYAQQSALRQGITAANKAGDTSKATELSTELEATNAKLTEAIAKAKELWTAIGGDQATAALTKIDTLNTKVDTAKEKSQSFGVSWQQVGDLFANGLTNAFDQFAQAVANGENVGKAARQAFLQFASDFLRQIAQMIIKAAIFNALNSFGKSFGLPGLVPGVSHAGGVVGGRQNRSREMPAAFFANAMRYHTGGVVGFKPNEVPIVAEKGEEVLAKSDARNVLNGGGKKAAPAAPPNVGVKVVNAFDAGSFISNGLQSSEGEQAFMNFVRSNGAAIKGALGG